MPGLEKHREALDILLRAAMAADEARGHGPRAELVPARRTRPYGGTVDSSQGCIAAANLETFCGQHAAFLFGEPLLAVQEVFGVLPEAPHELGHIARFPDSVIELVADFDAGNLPELVETT